MAGHSCNSEWIERSIKGSIPFLCLLARYSSGRRGLTANEIGPDKGREGSNPSLTISNLIITGKHQALRLVLFLRSTGEFMTPKQYEELVKHHTLVKRAKQLIKLDKKKVATRIKLVAFKQEAGMYPEDYIKEFDGCWK